MKFYAVKRMFTSGALQGIITTDIFNQPKVVGKQYNPCCNRCNYIVLDCVEITEDGKRLCNET